MMSGILWTQSFGFVALPGLPVFFALIASKADPSPPGGSELRRTCRSEGPLTPTPRISSAR